MDQLETGLSKTESVIRYALKAHPMTRMELEQRIDDSKEFSEKYVTGLVSRINQKCQEHYGQNAIEPRQVGGILHYKIRERALKRASMPKNSGATGPFFETEKNLDMMMLATALVIIYLILINIKYR